MSPHANMPGPVAEATPDKETRAIYQAQINAINIPLDMRGTDPENTWKVFAYLVEVQEAVERILPQHQAWYFNWLANTHRLRINTNLKNLAVFEDLPPPQQPAQAFSASSAVKAWSSIVIRLRHKQSMEGFARYLLCMVVWAAGKPALPAGVETPVKLFRFRRRFSKLFDEEQESLVETWDWCCGLTIFGDRVTLKMQVLDHHSEEMDMLAALEEFERMLDPPCQVVAAAVPSEQVAAFAPSAPLKCWGCRREGHRVADCPSTPREKRDEIWIDRRKRARR